MEPSLDYIHVEIETGLILARMAGIVHETELFACADRIRAMAGKAHRRASQRLEKTAADVINDADRAALLKKIEHLKKSVDPRASAGSA